MTSLKIGNLDKILIEKFMHIIFKFFEKKSNDIKIYIALKINFKISNANFIKM